VNGGSRPAADDQKTKICSLRVAAFIKQQRLGTNPTKQRFLTGLFVPLLLSGEDGTFGSYMVTTQIT
jgi:hypothetical protein